MAFFYKTTKIVFLFLINKYYNRKQKKIKLLKNNIFDFLNMQKSETNSRARRKALHEEQRRKFLEDYEAKTNLLLGVVEELNDSNLELESSSKSAAENVYRLIYGNNCENLLSFFEKQLKAVSSFLNPKQGFSPEKAFNPEDYEETKTDLVIEGSGWYASSLIMHNLTKLSTRECREIADTSTSDEMCISEKIDARICKLALDYADPKGEE